MAKFIFRRREVTMKTKRKSVIPRLIKECKKIAFPLIISSLITLLTVAAGLYAPDVLGNLTQKIYDASSGTGNADLNEFLRYAAILAAVYLLKIKAQQRTEERKNYKIKRKTRKECKCQKLKQYRI